MDRQQANDRAAVFAEHRAYLFATAYRMLGVAEDAEDVLQDAWLRFAESRAEEVERPRAYLVSIVSRLAVDVLRSARRTREEYVGTWLPEPVPSREVLPDELIDERESVSFAFLLLLERLTPLQRVVLVLVDVLGYRHAEVAAMVSSNPTATRQVLRRARLELGETAPPKSPPPQESHDLAARFREAAVSGDLEAFLDALAPDVVLMSDGVGRVSAVSRPLVGDHRVSRFLATVRKQGTWDPVVLTELNGQPTVLVHEDGVLTNAIVLDLSRSGVTALYAVRNPEKLRRLADPA